MTATKKTDNINIPDMDAFIAKCVEQRDKHPPGTKFSICRFRATGVVNVWPTKSKAVREKEAARAQS